MINEQPNLDSRGKRTLTEKDLEGRIRRLEKQLVALSSLNVDMNGRRVINAKPSRHDHDYIIRQELDNAVENIRQQFVAIKPPTVVPDDLSKYTLDYVVKRINYGSFSLDEIALYLGSDQVNVSDVDVDGLYVVAACIDEVNLRGHTIITAIPSVVNTNVIVVTGLPTNWSVGDFILINDESSFLGIVYSYEIFRITNITGPAVTLERDGSDAGTLTSWFGTYKANHFGGYRAYKVDPINVAFPFKSNVFVNPTIRSGFAERADIVIPNVCVAGVYAAIYNDRGFGRWVSLSLATGKLVANSWESGDTDSRCPGLRTCNDGAYYIFTIGTLTLNAESDITIRPNSTSGIRCVWGYLNTAAETTGSTDPVATVQLIEIDEDTLVETVIETIQFYTGEIVSGNPSYPPETRQLPYNPKPDLLDDNADYHWPIPAFSADKRYKTKVTAIGEDVAGEDLVVVVST